VRGVQDLRMRWLGHRLHLEAAVQLDVATDLVAADRVTGRAAEVLRTRIPQLERVVLRASPSPDDADDADDDDGGIVR
jgi:divalent metal cation (Fe/Co/Zn/Cd) transporter